MTSSLLGWRRLRRNTSLLVGAGLFIFLVLVILLGPIVWPKSPTDMNYSRILQGPSLSAPFGTDDLGRDAMARVMSGGRTSLTIGAEVMLVTAIFGVLVGLATGFSRAADEVIMRFMDVFMAFPALLLALAVLAALGNKPINVVVALSFVYAPRTVRIVRGQVLTLMENVYVEAAGALGARRWRTLIRHVLPGVLPSLIVQETFLFAYAMLGEAGLSFVGVGIQPPIASWGNMLSESRVLLNQAPWMLFFPGAALSLTVLSLNLLGDALREALDPKRRL